MPENFQSKVEQQVDRLKRSAYREIEREVAQKRIAWVTQNHGASGKQERTSPRQAFETLFFDYMGIPADELPVQSETDTEIVWRSLNPCPTLEACQQLGFIRARYAGGLTRNPPRLFYPSLIRNCVSCAVMKKSDLMRIIARRALSGLISIA